VVDDTQPMEKQNLKFGELSTVDFHQTEVELTIIWVTEHISEPLVSFRMGNSFFTQTFRFVIQPALGCVRESPNLVQKVVDFKSRESRFIHNIRGYRSIRIVYELSLSSVSLVGIEVSIS
jgi:hypothetical protein